MNSLYEAYKQVSQLEDIVKTCRFLYGDRWQSVKKEIRDNILTPHHVANKTTSLLGSAITLSSEVDAKTQLAYLGASVDEEQPIS